MNLADLDDVLRNSQRIILDGRNYSDRVGWTADVITANADGHETADQVEVAMRGALQEARSAPETPPPPAVRVLPESAARNSHP